MDTFTVSQKFDARFLYKFLVQEHQIKRVLFRARNLHKKVLLQVAITETQVSCTSFLYVCHHLYNKNLQKRNHFCLQSQQRICNLIRGVRLFTELAHVGFGLL